MSLTPESRSSYQLVTRDYNMEFGVFGVVDVFLTPDLPENSPVLDTTPIRQGFQPGYETSQFLLPIVQSGRWSDH